MPDFLCCQTTVVPRRKLSRLLQGQLFRVRVGLVFSFGAVAFLMSMRARARHSRYFANRK
jgi:hypothetical protein